MDGIDRGRIGRREFLGTVPAASSAALLLDNLGAAQGRLPDAATRQRMEEFIDRL